MGKLTLNRSQKIGLFVVIALVALYASIKFLKGEDLFNSRRSFCTVTGSVEGLTVTSPVYIRGLKVGSIEKIEYNIQTDSFAITFNVKSEYEVADNSVAEIYSSDILGGKSLRIALGNSPETAKAGDTLECTTVPDMMSLLSEEIGPMKEQVSRLLDNMNTTFSNLNEILDEKARQDISASLSNLNSSLENLEEISGTINDITPQIKEVVQNMDSLSASLSGSAPQLESIIENLDRVSGAIADADVAAAIKSVRELADRLQDPEGSVGKLLSTDSLHNSVDSLVMNLNNFVEKMSENPKKFIKISVF